MPGLQFNVLFNSISVISGRWEGDNERLCALEPHLRLERVPSPAGLENRTSRPVLYLWSDQVLNAIIIEYDIFKTLKEEKL